MQAGIYNRLLTPLAIIRIPWPGILTKLQMLPWFNYTDLGTRPGRSHNAFEFVTKCYSPDTSQVP